MWLFDRFRRDRPAPCAAAGAPPAADVVALVLLREPAAADGEAVLAHLRRQGAQCELLPRITGLVDHAGTVTGRIPGGEVQLRSRREAVAGEALDRAVALARDWPAARRDVAAHRAHVMVRVRGATPHPMDAWRLHARLVGAVVATTPALGVYVPSATMVRSRDDWLDEALTTEGDAFPLPLWVAINPVHEADGRVSAYTTGMAALGLMELEVRGSTRPPEQVRELLMDAVAYQVGTENRLRDGDPFGYPAADRRPVRHLASRFLPGTRVAVLDGV